MWALSWVKALHMSGEKECPSMPAYLWKLCKSCCACWKELAQRNRCEEKRLTEKAENLPQTQTHFPDQMDPWLKLGTEATPQKAFDLSILCLRLTAMASLLKMMLHLIPLRSLWDPSNPVLKLTYHHVPLNSSVYHIAFYLNHNDSVSPIKHDNELHLFLLTIMVKCLSSSQAYNRYSINMHWMRKIMNNTWRRKFPKALVSRWFSGTLNGRQSGWSPHFILYMEHVFME